MQAGKSKLRRRLFWLFKTCFALIGAGFSPGPPLRVWGRPPFSPAGGFSSGSARGFLPGGKKKKKPLSQHIDAGAFALPGRQPETATPQVTEASAPRSSESASYAPPSSALQSSEGDTPGGTSTGTAVTRTRITCADTGRTAHIRATGTGGCIQLCRRASRPIADKSELHGKAQATRRAPQLRATVRKPSRGCADRAAAQPATPANSAPALQSTSVPPN